MRENFLAFSPPWLGEEEIAEVAATLRSDWITTGPKVLALEEAFSSFVGAPAALAVNSGTAALHVALARLRLGPETAVITTPMTFCSTVHVIEQVGATPLLVDVERDTLNLDPQRVDELLRGGFGTDGPGQPRGVGRREEKEVRALLPVHYGGHPCDMASIRKVAGEHDLSVVEDAAHALPAKYKGAMIGGPASDPVSLVAFSFYATKNMTTAEGGMLTGERDAVEEARLWSYHGMSRHAHERLGAKGWYYEVLLPGFKYNMSDIQAAIGLHQLAKLPRFHLRRREIAARYSEAFAEMEEVEVPREEPDCEHAWHLYVLRLNLRSLKISRDEFLEELADRNIGGSVHFIPIHLHPYYRHRYGYEPQDFPVAYGEYERLVSLPIYPKMTGSDVEDVIGAVRDVVQRYRQQRC